MSNAMAAGLAVRTLNNIKLSQQMKGRVFLSLNSNQTEDNVENGDQITIKDAFRSWAPILITGVITALTAFLLEIARNRQNIRENKNFYEVLIKTTVQLFKIF